MSQDRALQVAQRGRRLDPERVDEDRPCAPVGLECLGLSARAVEREDQARIQLLAERVLGAEALELSDKRLVTAECEVRVDALLERREADLVEAPDRRPGKRLRGEVCKRLAAPQVECRAKELGCSLGVSADERVAGPFGGVLESAQVELVGFDPNDVARCVRLDRRRGAEDLAQLRHLPLDLGDRRDGRGACVEILGEPLD